MNSPDSSEQHFFLQPFWDYVLTEFGDIVSSPFFPVLLAFSGYLCFSFPFAIIDILGERCPFLFQYKIQKNKRPTVKMMILCIWKAVYNHVIYVFPAVFLNWWWMPPQPLPVNAPTVCTLLGEVLGCLLLFDFQYFIWHVLHHKNHWLYKKVHAVHHIYFAPFSWSSQNLGGYELMTVGFWSSMNPIRLGCHPLASWTCNLLSIWMSVEDHIGYNFPWSLTQIVPYGLYGGVLAHDLHHQRPDTNFAPFFGHWDLICGTSYSMIIAKQVLMMEVLSCLAHVLDTYHHSRPLLQQLWDHLRLQYFETLRSPLFPVVLTVSCYVIFCIPYLIFNIMGRRWPFIHKYKIQQDRNPTGPMIFHCLGVTLYNHLFLIFPAAVTQWYWRPPCPLPEDAPSILDIAFGVMGSLLLFDFQYFIWHMIHHRNRWLYKTFHAIHHEYMAPFALATQCLGGWELVTVGFWTTLNPIIIRCHLLTTWIFMVFHVYVSVEDHCGYDFPWSTSRLMPFGIYGGPIKHDVHHQKPMSNYAPHFTHWDKIFGTHADFTSVKGILELDTPNKTCCASTEEDSLYDESVPPTDRVAEERNF